MSAHHIRHIPIVSDQDSVIGMVTDRDIKNASPSIFETEKGSSLFSGLLKRSWY